MAATVSTASTMRSVPSRRYENVCGARRSGPMAGLLDMLKETDLALGFPEAFPSLGSRATLDRRTLQMRLLRCLYGLGTNAGLKRMASIEAGVSYPELLYVRRRFIHKDPLRE